MSNKQGTQTSSGNDSSENSDGEDQDEPSSLKHDNDEELLMNFRQEWQKELQVLKYQKTNVASPNKTENNAEDGDDEVKATNLFLKGVEMERSGKVYEAIQFYRRAVQLVPDIEFRLEESIKNKTRADVEDDNKQDYPNATKQNDENSDDIDSEDDSPTHSTLLQRIQRKINRCDYLCLPKIEQKETHISALPTEILLYILRWVVSSDLDLRSLEMFGQTCRGFYLCARDQEIWRSSCERAWGLNCGTLMGIYPTWRDMFLERAMLYFNGCYISKTTYIRQGESSFQDQFYRPWHLVAYYRYLRFFPEGVVLMLTTPDEPAQCVGLLKQRQVRSSSVLTGHYRLKEDIVTIMVQRQESIKNPYRRSRRRDPAYTNNQQTFHLELKIQSHSRKRHIQLIWKRYSVYTLNKNGTESSCTFDLVGNNFPPLWYSRVKSYTAESEQPLQ